MSSARNLRIAVVICLLAVSFGSFASEKVLLGFGTQVVLSGYLPPRLKRVIAAQILPGSPAEKAGLSNGDVIIEANGKAIEGASAWDMARQLRNIKAGEHLILKVERGNKKLVNIDIVAGS